MHFKDTNPMSTNNGQINIVVIHNCQSQIVCLEGNLYATCCSCMTCRLPKKMNANSLLQTTEVQTKNS
jgi:hypothetical protein